MQVPPKRKKVLYLITKATWGGAQRYVYDLASRLPRNHYEAGVIYGVEGKLAEAARAAGIKTRRLRALARDVAVVSDIRSFVQIFRTIKSARPEVLHLNSSKAAALGALAGRLRGVPRIIFTVHGWPFREDRFFLSRSIIYFISWLTALFSHAVVVASHADERAARAMRGVAHKTYFIPHGIEPAPLRTPEDAYRAMFGALSPAPLSAGTWRLVSLAELTRNKGIGFAIEAVSILRERGIDALYVVAGDGEERPALERLIRKYGVADRVYLPGFIQDAAKNLSGFDVYLLPSIKEGTPYVLLEADCAGLPIVATDAVDAELVRNFIAGRQIPAGNALALADAIETLAKKPRSPHSGDRYPIHDMVTRTLELYD